MKTQTVLIIRKVECRCPECNEITEGYLGDPRGGVYECEWCDAKFEIHKEADLEFEG
ncbi:MAG: hypothetical protein GOVbin8609_49 [Prokaryotic dsDNA virus sp.]|nr:MAG: hypothetical protein GOVbin8609_49 [Prokaryotic dsDNA virus sp.]|tara:strand:+ start:19911 stop:20081 length:171 start_codon:yes stop_codon:yes gene_type:complete